MAYPIAQGSVLQISIEGTANGQQFISIFSYKFVTGTTISSGSAAALNAISAFSVAGSVKPAYQGCLPDTVNDMKIYAQWVTPIRYRYVIDPAGAFAGTVPQPYFPQNVSVALTRFGEQANRHSIGTLHMPAVPVTHIDDGQVNGAGFAAYDVLANELQQALVLPAGQELAPVLFDRATPASSQIVQGGFTQPTARVMRRRTVGLGT